MPVASTTTSAQPAAADARADDAAASSTAFAYAPGRKKWGLRRLLTSALRIADLQYRIWLTRAKIALIKAALFAGLFAVAMVLAILAVIFLYIGVFRLLTDVAGLRPVWAFLIFGGGNLLLAGILAWIGVAVLSARTNNGKIASSDADETHAATGKGAGQ